MKKQDLDKLRSLHTQYLKSKKDACTRKDWHYAELYEAKAVAICEVLEVLDGIDYIAAVEKIMEE